MPRLPRFPFVACSVLVFAACVSKRSEEKKQLASHQHNAMLYWEGGKLDQAMQLVERGLEIDPGDYKLNALRGTILLRRSTGLGATDHKKLEEAADALAEVYDTRDVSRHEPFLLFFYALALERQGLRFAGEAVRLREIAARTPSQEASDRRDEEQRKAEEKFALATELLESLVARGEMARMSHYHLLQIAVSLQDGARALHHEKEYLKRLERDRSDLEKAIQTTTVALYEQERLRQREALFSEEIAVRNVLAEFHFDRRDYENALAHLDAVLRLDPTRSVDYYNRGRVLRELGRGEAAKDDFRKFLATSTLPASSQKKIDALQALEQ